MKPLEQERPLIPSTSQRLPQKSCGLFDTGFAGDAADVASLGLGVPADIDQSVFTYGDPGPSSSQRLTTADNTKEKTTPVDQSACLDDLDFDLLDPLGGLEDPLGDSSLDAFVDLESLLSGNSFFGESNQIEPATESAEVEPIISFDSFLEPGQAETLQLPLTSHKPVKSPRKRKTVAPKLDDVFKVPEASPVSLTSTFADHDYITKSPGIPIRESLKKKTMTSKAPKRRRTSSTISTDSDASSTCSTFAIEEEDQELDKQTVRRIKNNIASKRSREQRKQKLTDMDEEAEKLVVANEELRQKIVELEKMAKEMKELLVAKMAGKA